MTHRLPVSILVVLCLSWAQRVPANPRDKVSGSFRFYDRSLDHETDDPNNHYGRGQAQLIEHDGNVELFEWGGDPYKGRCLRFTPEKIGDSISFRIHIASVETTKAVPVETHCAYFNNEGIYQLLVDDEVAGAEHDCYQHDKWQNGEWPIEPGDYKITYRYVGQNPKSTGSVLNLVSLDIG